MATMSAYAVAGDAASVRAEDSTQQLLTGFQFFFLCLIVMASYYVSLCISAHAVGESTAALRAPIAAASSLFADIGTTILRTINRRRNHTQAGAVSYEDESDDVTDIYSVNQPGPGVR
ncbi:hypothetical protein GH5_03343 [Leishmania sp. Ghana 2012 LV757]|uniref:hypothetical protein n=1 Tax=Leishmania sp. Ghana 2012 LV757 TaxID=2803181 RepID=UPI001B462DC1|nr:hypothetical protein GH5_03343 [Leishmania sp. Ghana 2012 LV757]